MVGENYNKILKKIEESCKRAGRDPKEVTLIAVSKTKPVPMLEQAYNAGARDFGENKVQEIRDKYPVLPEDIKWHMIGHLQTNKVKYIVDKVCLIHSVDSYHLAEEISKQAVKKGCEVDILIEVNMAEEESKFGLFKEEVIDLIKEVALLKNIHIKGLMTIAPYVTDPEDNRKYFKAIKDLSIDIDKKNIDNVSMSVLSMGMTGDYEVAVEEGATLVRVGTGIFGERNYQI
ncbi:MAG: YggS family pyridoxal phosphate-dependent enzyme [Eubacterium sp.]|nr:YggS family pyridoxal phosphate-dependent enzyme [Eubacterium sp.]